MSLFIGPDGLTIHDSTVATLTIDNKNNVNVFQGGVLVKSYPNSSTVAARAALATLIGQLGIPGVSSVLWSTDGTTWQSQPVQSVQQPFYYQINGVNFPSGLSSGGYIAFVGGEEGAADIASSSSTQITTALGGPLANPGTYVMQVFTSADVLVVQSPVTFV